MTTHEIYMSACIGVARQLSSLKRGGRNKVCNKDFGWHTDIEAASAELAFAKWAGMYWDGSINTFKLPDVSSFQVRHTPYPNGNLIIRKEDADNEKYVLVTGSRLEFCIRGWIKGGAAKQDRFLQNPNGQYQAWFVPQNYLNRMEDLNIKKG